MRDQNELNDVEQLRIRHSLLGDKKLLTGLTEEESNELAQINLQLDASEEEYYAPIKDTLATVRASFSEERRVRSFIWCSKAWYADASEFENSDEITFYGPSPDCPGEMGMVWIELGSSFVPQLQVFDDAWGALAGFGDLIKELGAKDDQTITPEQFIAILLSCGFVDRTEYKSPHTPRETALRKELVTLKKRMEKIEDQLGKQ